MNYSCNKAEGNYHPKNTFVYGMKKDTFLSTNKTILSFMQSLLPPQYFINLADGLCRSGECIVAKDDHVFYRDDNHLSDDGAKWLAIEIPISFEE